VAKLALEKQPSYRSFAWRSLPDTITTRTADKEPLVPKGHVLAWTQLELPISTPSTPLPVDWMPSLDLRDSPRFVDVIGEDFQLRLTKLSGRLTSLVYREVELIRTGLEPNFTRQRVLE